MKGTKKFDRMVAAEGKRGKSGTYPVAAFEVKAHRRRYPTNTWHRTDMRHERNLADAALTMVWVAEARNQERGKVSPLLRAAVEAVERWARQQGLDT